MSAGPIHHALGFWKPLLDASVFEGLAVRTPIETPPEGGIHILPAEGQPDRFTLDDGAEKSFLFAAVHPISEPPPEAEVIARITTVDGSPHSYVLWFPEQRRVLIPFDPDSAIDALRYEHYMADEPTVLPGGVLAAYYRVKKVLPKPVRLALRRALAHRDDQRSRDLAWPADHSHDRLMRLLLRAMMLASGESRMRFVWFWPHGHSWAAVLTHDVETGKGLEVVPRVMEIEAQRGLCSSFNFVPRDYDVPDELRAELARRGFEVGVHGYTHDGLLVSSWSTFAFRAERINSVGREWKAAGFRSPATYRNLEWFRRLDFEYDSSVTDTAPHEPQPGGCASVFPYLIGDLVEMPMTLPQDHTLFGVLKQRDASTWIDKLATIKRDNGMACVLTHPEPGAGYIGEPKNEERYRHVLDVISADDAWTPLPRDLARWWKERAQMPAGQLVGVRAVAGEAVLDETGQIRLEPPTRPAEVSRRRHAVAVGG